MIEIGAVGEISYISINFIFLVIEKSTGIEIAATGKRKHSFRECPKKGRIMIQKIGDPASKNREIFDLGK